MSSAILPIGYVYAAVESGGTDYSSDKHTHASFNLVNMTKNSSEAAAAHVSVWASNASRYPRFWAGSYSPC